MSKRLYSIRIFSNVEGEVHLFIRHRAAVAGVHHYAQTLQDVNAVIGYLKAQLMRTVNPINK